MKTLILLAISLSTASAFALKADIKNAEGKDVGTATFAKTNSGAKMSLDVRNLPPGPHAVHIHETGKCEAKPGGKDTEQFTSAGPHYNPDKKKHGLQNPEGPHAGDMPGIEASKDGKAKADLALAHVKKLDDLKGRSVMIHATADDDKSDPAGNAGARIACGVIQ